MLNFYRSLRPTERKLVWVAAIALLIAILAPRPSSAGLVAGAQVAAALGTFALAGLAFAQVREMRATRIAQERPQVIVDLVLRRQLAYVVVRNIGKGAAKQITFEFSAPLKKPKGDPVNKLPHFTKGIDYLAPGAELSTYWDSMITLKGFLTEEDVGGGIIATSRYRSLSDDVYKTEWTINPLLLMDTLPMRDATMTDLVSEMKGMRKDYQKVIDVFNKELKVSTLTERDRREAATRREAEEMRSEEEGSQ